MHDGPPKTLKYAPHVAIFGVGWALLTYSAVPAFIVAKYDTTLVMVGLFMSASLAMFVVAQLPAGWLLSRYSTVTVLGAALLTHAAVTIVLDVAPTLAIALLFRTFLGLLSGVILSVGATHISRLFSGTAATRQQGFFGGMVTLGGAAGFLTAPVLVHNVGGLGIHAVGGLFSLVAAGMLLVNRDVGWTAADRTNGDSSVLDVIRNPMVLACAVCYAATLGSYITLSTFITSYFIDLNIVGPLNAGVMVLATLGRGFGGVSTGFLTVSDARFTRLVTTVGALSFFGLVLPNRLVAIVFPLVAMVAVSLPFGPVYNLAADATVYDGSALAFIVGIGNGSAAVLPVVTGYTRTVTGNYRMAFILIGVFLLLAVASLLIADRRTTATGSERGRSTERGRSPPSREWEQ